MSAQCCAHQRCANRQGNDSGGIICAACYTLHSGDVCIKWKLHFQQLPGKAQQYFNIQKQNCVQFAKYLLYMKQ